MVKVFQEKNLIDKLVESRRADKRSHVLIPHGPHFIFAVTKKSLNVSEEASTYAPTGSNNSDIPTPALAPV